LGVALKPHRRQRQLLHPRTNAAIHPARCYTITAAGLCRVSLAMVRRTTSASVKTAGRALWICRCAWTTLPRRPQLHRANISKNCLMKTEKGAAAGPEDE